MAGGEKTEKPTPKRLQEARDKGQIPKSTDLTSAIVLTGATMMLGYWGSYTYQQMSGTFTQSYQHLLVKLAKPVASTDMINLFVQLILNIVTILWPFFLGGLVLAILANIIQNKPHVSMAAIQPKGEKINPISGFKRIFSMRSIVEVVKSIIKMAIMAACAFSIIKGHEQLILALSTTTPMVAIGKIMEVMSSIAMTACVIFMVLGIVDFFYQKYEHEKSLKMSLQEIKDEHKNVEGDPKIKGRIREMGIQMSRKQQLAKVKTADVVITNPTHYAIAIKYDASVAPAPIVIAKGVDHFAMKIREEAKAHGVTIQENKPLARALYAMVEVGYIIPPELFIAVAEVLAIVFAKRNKKRNRAPMA